MKVKEVNTGKYINFILESSNMPVAILELDGMAIQVNDIFRERFQVQSLGNIKELLDRNSADMWEEVSRFVRKADSLTYEMIILLEENKMIPVKVKIMYCDVMKKLIAQFVVPPSTDEEAETTQRNLFHKVDKLLVIIDRNGIVRDINEVCNDFFNVSPSFFINKKATDFISLLSVSPERYENHLKLSIENGFEKVIKRYEQSPGDVRYCQITTFYDTETFMYLMRITDETNRIALQEKLAHNDSLSSVGQLAASVAHEIRNPLTTLKGFTQLLKSSATEETMKYLNVIDDEIDRMESILSEMLVLSKPSKNEKKIISLQDLLTDIILVISPKASLEGIVIERSVDVISSDSVYGDIIKLKQVFLNLLKNALEAMTSGGRITIGMERKNDGYLIVTIADTGKGMSIAHLKKIFKPFFTTRSEGTGLGLSFVIETMENHSGTISVESEVNCGTVFTLTFPPAISLVPIGVINKTASTILGIMA